MTKNIFNGYITTIVGIIVYVITSILIYKGTIDFWYQGIVGYGVGTLLLMSPKTIENIINKFVDSKTKP